MGVSRELYLYPRPLEGENWGRFVQASASDIAKRKKTAKKLSSSFRERKTRLEPTLWAFLANYIYTPSPWKGRIGVARSKSRYTQIQNKNDNQKAVVSCFERKTRLEPTLWAITRELYLYPRPLKGVFGVASCKLIILKSKRIALSYPFDFERKTRLELATPTLARLCSTN